ncbi:MAG TPA: DUF1573 domain-containing protein [Cytophagaceae bacterium]|jgi:hypothetical protein
MYKIIFALLLSFSSILVNAQDKTGAEMTFTEPSHDFGDIRQGEKVEYVFKYKNTGKEPLIISEVLTTCGCTATKWDKNPIPAGGQGQIVASFNSEGKMGRQNKVITVLSNAPTNTSRITIIANVLPAK